MNFHLHDNQTVTIEVENKKTKMKVTFNYIIELTPNFNVIVRKAKKIAKGYFLSSIWKIKSINIST